MLPKNKRIPKNLFGIILEKGKYSNSDHFTLRVAPSPDNRARFAVSVSKKVSKKAVDRNRIRRRTYSTLNSLLPNMEPRLYLIVAKKGAEKLKGESLKSELDHLFSKFLTAN